MKEIQVWEGDGVDRSQKVDGFCYDYTEVVALLRDSGHQVSEIVCHRVDNKLLFPSWQFKNRRLIQGITRIVSCLSYDCYEWFTTEKPQFDDRSPADLIVNGNIGRVLDYLNLPT